MRAVVLTEPSGVRLTAYSGEAADLPAAALQRVLARLASGEMTLGPIRTYRLGQIRDAHGDVESNAVSGKLVITT
jgi:NADPH2:quinone reductase